MVNFEILISSLYLQKVHRKWFLWNVVPKPKRHLYLGFIKQAYICNHAHLRVLFEVYESFWHHYQNMTISPPFLVIGRTIYKFNYKVIHGTSSPYQKFSEISIKWVDTKIIFLGGFKELICLILQWFAKICKNLPFDNRTWYSWSNY